MKYDELSDISTILIEPGDEKATVLDHVSIQSKPVVVVLPDHANRVFQQPADFSELRRVRRQSGTSIMLVITGSERLRQWARRHGFPVYTSIEACGRALARRDRLQTGRYASGQLAGFAPRVTRKLLNTEPLEAMKRWQDAATEDDKDDDGWPGWEYARAYEYEGGAHGYPHLAQGSLAHRGEKSPSSNRSLSPASLNGETELAPVSRIPLGGT